MKKYLFLLFALVALCSCGPATVETKIEQGVLEEFDRVTHFTYKGHQYIKFEKPYKIGIVHDPNCDCHENSN